MPWRQPSAAGSAPGRWSPINMSPGRRPLGLSSGTGRRCGDRGRTGCHGRDPGHGFGDHRGGCGPDLDHGRRRGETVVAGSGGLTYTGITPSGTAVTYIAAGDGPNLIATTPDTAGNYSINTGAGADTISVSGNAVVNAGSGANSVSVTGGNSLVYSEGFDNITLSSGTDTINVGSSQATINPGLGQRVRLRRHDQHEPADRQGGHRVGHDLGWQRRRQRDRRQRREQHPVRRRGRCGVQPDGAARHGQRRPDLRHRRRGGVRDGGCGQRDDHRGGWCAERLLGAGFDGE